MRSPRAAGPGTCFSDPGYCAGRVHSQHRHWAEKGLCCHDPASPGSAVSQTLVPPGPGAGKGRRGPRARSQHSAGCAWVSGRSGRCSSPSSVVAGGGSASTSLSGGSQAALLRQEPGDTRWPLGMGAGGWQGWGLGGPLGLAGLVLPQWQLWAGNQISGPVFLSCPSPGLVRGQ